MKGPGLCCLLLFLAPEAFAKVVWRGDFETGNLSQYTRTQSVSPERLQVVQSPSRQGTWALKATVRQGDDPIGASGNRNELLYLSNEPSGSEYYYKWSTRFAPNYPSAKTWQLFAQWHHYGCCGSPPVQFVVNGETMSLSSVGTTVWNAPLVRDQWLDFVFHVKWSANANEGFIEMWLNGKLVVPKRFVATQFPGEVNYLKVGLYRNSTIAQEGVVYHDGWMQATTLEDVMPAPEKENPPPAQTPDTGGSAVTENAPAPLTPETVTTPEVAPTGEMEELPSFGCSTAGTLLSPLGGLFLLALFGRRVRRPKRLERPGFVEGV